MYMHTTWKDHEYTEWGSGGNVLRSLSVRVHIVYVYTHYTYVMYVHVLYHIHTLYTRNVCTRMSHIHKLHVYTEKKSETVEEMWCISLMYMYAYSTCTHMIRVCKLYAYTYIVQKTRSWERPHIHRRRTWGGRGDAGRWLAVRLYVWTPYGVYVYVVYVCANVYI